MLRPLKNVFGISLLEVMLSLTVIAAIIALSIRYYQVVDNQTDITSAIKQVGNLTQAARDWQQAQQQYSFAGLDNTALTSGGYATLHNLTDPWGGTIHVCKGYTNATTVGVQMDVTSHAVCCALAGKLSRVMVGPINNITCNSGGTGQCTTTQPTCNSGGAAGVHFYGEF